MTYKCIKCNTVYIYIYKYIYETDFIKFAIYTRKITITILITLNTTEVNCTHARAAMVLNVHLQPVIREKSLGPPQTYPLQLWFELQM